MFDYHRCGFEEQKAAYVSNYLGYVDKIDIDLTNLSWVKDLDDVKAYHPMQTIAQQYKPCVTLDDKFIIHWNGDVFACNTPYNFEDVYFLSNLHGDTTLFDMYYSEKIGKLRAQTAELRHGQLPLCQDCYSNTNKYEQLKKESKPC